MNHKLLINFDCVGDGRDIVVLGNEKARKDKLYENFIQAFETNKGCYDVEFLNRNGGFVSGGNFVWGAATKACPGFIYQGQINIHSYSRQQKLNKIKEMLSAGYYVVAEVKGNTGQHWVAIDAVQGETIVMMDPGSSSTDMWGQYNWRNTSTLAWYKV